MGVRLAAPWAFGWRLSGRSFGGSLGLRLEGALGAQLEALWPLVWRLSGFFEALWAFLWMSPGRSFGVSLGVRLEAFWAFVVDPP